MAVVQREKEELTGHQVILMKRKDSLALEIKNMKVIQTLRALTNKHKRRLRDYKIINWLRT